MNREHFLLLERTGAVAAWNVWRYENPHIRPDLSDANLVEANLTDINFRQVCLQGVQLQCSLLPGASFRSADLDEADLSDAQLDGADLRYAQLTSAQLVKASLRGADLRGARLDFANLREADLRKAQLRGASLGGANLVSADLRETDLTGVEFHNVSLVDTALPDSIVDAKVSSCLVDWRTVARSRHIEHFERVLQRCGMPEAAAVALLEQMRAMPDDDLEALLMPIWIAHAPEDADLAQRVRSGLEARGFKTWFYRAADTDMPSAIDLRVSKFDRTVLICTAATLRQDGLDYEIECLLERDMHVGGGDLIVAVVAEPDLFKVVDADGSLAWWCKDQADCVHAALYARPYVDVVDALDDEKRWAARLDTVAAQLRLPVDTAAKRKASDAHCDEIRRRRGLA